MEDSNVHHRVLKLRDVALGLRKSVRLNSELAPASYDCALDSLFALQTECKSAASLAKDKNVQKFTKKYEGTISTLERLRMSAEDFEVKSTIGRGHFGEVVVCHEKSTGDVFAMKIMKKAHILQQPDAAFFSAERDIMAWSTSPWLTSLHYAFQDHTSLYLVMDYHPGGDLLNVMERKEGSMQEDETRFYLAEIAAGLHDLHCLGFVHRDMKPENVLIARSGHIKLADFGSVASLNNKGKVMDAQLPIGTPEYIAPEVLMSLSMTADYGTCCDWWSLGVIAYELLYEATPFEGDATSKIYSNIMSYKNSLTFPDEPKSTREEEAQDLIKSLLTDMQGRLTYEGIQAHTFFSLTDWIHLLDAVPPHIPKVSEPDDVSNFDVFEPLKEADLRYPDLPGKKTGFSGKTLPFIGFTFNRLMMSMDDYMDSGVVSQVETKAVEPKEKTMVHKKELDEARRKSLSLERECEVYQSQLEDYHRRLEMERCDRRVSDSRALQLLQEVKEKGKLAQQLREEQMRTTEVEYSAVVEQLEQERQETSQRAQKLQQRLKEMQQERDTALNKMADYKRKLTEVKETSNKEIADLQAKLIEMSKDANSKVSEVQRHLQEVHKHYTEALDKVRVAENAKRKAEFGLQKLQTNMDEYSITTTDISQQLKELKNINDSLQSKVDGESKASEDLRKQSVFLAKQVKELETQLEEAFSEKSSLRSSQQSLECRVKELEEQLEEKNEEVTKFLEQNEADKRTRSEELRRKEEEIVRLETSCSSIESRLKDKEDRHRITRDERMRKALNKAETLEKENNVMKSIVSNLSEELSAKSEENEALKIKIEEVEEKGKNVMSDLRTEVRLLQSKLSETTTMALQQGDKLREARKARRELDQQNETHSIRLREVQRECAMLKKQLKESRSEVENLCTAQDRLKQAQLEIQVLQGNNEVLKNEAMGAQQFLKELTASSDQAHSVAYALRGRFESQEINTAMLRRNIKSLEDQLKESQTVAQEAQKQLQHWESVKEIVEKDLEVAEAKLDEITQSRDNEKKARLAVEQQLSKTAVDMETLIVDHSEELQRISSQLVTQKELAGKYSSKVLEVEKEMRLKALTLKETQKELGTEKAVSSKFYDDIQSKSRELCKLKAAHMKLLKEVQQQNSELVERDQILNQQRIANEERQVQETRLQATITQQNKLIDYLQGVGVSTEPKGHKGLGKIKKGLKLGRKRDPAKEIAEWNKLKGIAGKGSVVQSASTTSISSSSSHAHPLQATPSSHLAPSSSFLSSTSNSSSVYVPFDHTEVTSDAHPNMDTYEGITVERPPTPGSEITVDRNGEPVEMNRGPHEKIIVAQHDIPHRFNSVSKSGLRSHSTCIACKGPIKALQKLNKCDYCHVTCHTQCITSIPNNCGLPEEMSAYMDQPAAKRSRLDPRSSPLTKMSVLTSREARHKKTRHPKNNSKKGGALLLQIAKNLSGLDNSRFQVAGNQDKNKRTSDLKGAIDDKTQNESGSICATQVKGNGTSLHTSRNETVQGSGIIEHSSSDISSPDGVHVEISKEARDINTSQSKRKMERNIENIYWAGFETSKVVMMERMSQPRGGIMTEGWLVLTRDVLSFYDRDPRGVTRKPINHFVLNQPGVAYIILPSITRAQLPHVSPPTLIKAFGLQIYSSSTFKELCLVAMSLQSKIDWVEGLQKVLTQHGSPPQRTDSASEPWAQDIEVETSRQGCSIRELKEVTIVPITTPPKRVNMGIAGRGPQRSSPIVTRSGSRPASSCDTSFQESKDSLNLSIHSSMLEISSESSFV